MSMRGLTLHRPWDYAMAHGGKNIENRPWKPWSVVMGQRIALHAGKQFDDVGAKKIANILGLGTAGYENMIIASKSGVIVATTRITDCVFIGDVFGDTLGVKNSPWFFGPYGWICEDTIALLHPVPCSGAQGLWKLPDQVEEEVLRQEELSRDRK